MTEIIKCVVGVTCTSRVICGDLRLEVVVDNSAICVDIDADVHIISNLWLRLLHLEILLLLLLILVLILIIVFTSSCLIVVPFIILVFISNIARCPVILRKLFRIHFLVTRLAIAIPVVVVLGLTTTVAWHKLIQSSIAQLGILFNKTVINFVTEIVGFE